MSRQTGHEMDGIRSIPRVQEPSDQAKRDFRSLACGGLEVRLESAWLAAGNSRLQLAGQ